MSEKIDIVIYWVDGSDPDWLAKRRSYETGTTSTGAAGTAGSTSDDASVDIAPSRYRDWGNLQYVFRGIEKFAPWVNKVFFVSDGQVPGWMDTSDPRLVLVDHRDFIPEEFLPTFSANPIELNLHRIPGLSEQFVVFNDDCFLTGPVEPEDFFIDGKPRDILMEYPIMCGGTNPVFSNILANDFNLIGRYFERKAYKKALRSKILNFKYGKYFFYNLYTYMMPFPRFYGLLTPHFGRPHLKSSFEEVWAKEGDLLMKTCSHRFRSPDDVNIYIFRMWNLLKGNFVPQNVFKFGHAFFMHGMEDMAPVIDCLSRSKYKMVCINDDIDEDPHVSAGASEAAAADPGSADGAGRENVFETVRDGVNRALDALLPERSGFEKAGGGFPG